MSGEILAANPASAAGAEALQIFNQRDHYERATEDETILRDLDHRAEALDFIDHSYWVVANRAISIPVSFEEDQPVSVISFNRTSFEGRFVCYSKVAIGRIVGARTIHALCLSFDEATLMPYMDKLPEDHLLYVPVAAVDEIDMNDRP